MDPVTIIFISSWESIEPSYNSYIDDLVRSAKATEWYLNRTIRNVSVYVVQLGDSAWNYCGEQVVTQEVSVVSKALKQYQVVSLPSLVYCHGNTRDVMQLSPPSVSGRFEHNASADEFFDKAITAYNEFDIKLTIHK